MKLKEPLNNLFVSYGPRLFIKTLCQQLHTRNLAWKLSAHIQESMLKKILIFSETTWNLQSFPVVT